VAPLEEGLRGDRIVFERRGFDALFDPKGQKGVQMAFREFVQGKRMGVRSIDEVCDVLAMPAGSTCTA